MSASKTGKNTRYAYGNQSISALKGADRVRKRPAVIFGSDGLEGCEHSVFEILSNAVDEAREGFGNEIRITVFADKSIEVDDHGRGMPLAWNEKEGRYNWELVFCELYAGGKYNNNSKASAYEYSLGLNGLGACATQYSSEYMHVASYDGENVSEIDFKKGEADGELQVRPLEKKEKRTGTESDGVPTSTFHGYRYPARLLRRNAAPPVGRQRRDQVRRELRDAGRRL